MDNATIARTLYEDWNARDFDHAASLVADDGEIVVVGSGQRFRGPDGMREYDRMWADAFPDGKVTIDDIVSAGDTVVVCFTGRGTHTGTLRTPGGDIAPTGRSLTLELCDVLEIRDGKVRSGRTYFDSGSLLMQLGVMPEARVTA
jgi:ketosteroid isomerase-like protein